MPGEDVDYRLKSLEEDRERNSSQHREFYAALKEIEKHDAVVDERYNTILSTASETRAAVAELKAKPGKRWETVVDKVILIFVAAVIGFLLARAGIG